MHKVFNILPTTFFLFCGNAFCASDGFSAVRCGSDIPKALIGQTMSNERVVLIEERHKDLGLEDLGGSEISERLFLISWQICGDEYALLEEKSVVRDVLKFPRHSKDSPEFIGSCQIDGNDVSDPIIAVLRNERGAQILSATAAWRIDEKRARFVKIPTKGLRCPRNGIITADERR
jgi:hypothetical protein